MRHLEVVLDRSLERTGVGTNDLLNLLAVLEEHESRHSADGELLRDIRNLIYVEFVEASILVIVGEPDNLRQQRLLTILG